MGEGLFLVFVRIECPSLLLSFFCLSCRLLVRTKVWGKGFTQSEEVMFKTVHKSSIKEV